MVRIATFAQRLAPISYLDSIVEIQDSAGNRPETCRVPDQPRDPEEPYLASDPTPDAFDDPCLSDDAEWPALLDSLLEFRPAATGTYYLNVRDFRGDGRPELLYELSLTGAN